MMDERWSGLDFGAQWYERVERKRASAMLDRLVDLAERQPLAS